MASKSGCSPLRSLHRAVNLAQQPGPWQKLGARLHQLAVKQETISGELRNTVSHIIMPGDAEPERLNLLKKCDAYIAVFEKQRRTLVPTDRTWAWSVTGCRRGNAMKYLRLILWLVLGLRGWLPALHAQLHDGDRLVFCGDSITDQKTYTRLVMDYFALRHPGTKLVFFNVGITGSTAGGWKKDGIEKHVLPLKPTVVSICLGMNDGGYRAHEQKTADAYEANLMSLITQIKTGGARVVLLTPGAIDDDTLPARYAKGIYNDTLDRLARRVEAIAAREKIRVFNIHDLMFDVQKRAKAKTPAFTMISDGVHPGEVGATVMAYGMLKRSTPSSPPLAFTSMRRRKLPMPNSTR